jgi:type IV pilus assembly protein PilW
MSRHPQTFRGPGGRQRGYTMVELMVTVAIALFLVGGLLTVLGNVRRTYTTQQALAQLQDQQRFALTVLTDVVQAGGYYPLPSQTVGSALTASGNYQAGQPFWGTAGPPDSIGVRYATNNLDGVLLCDGSSNASGSIQLYTNSFTVVGGQLLCTLNANAPLALVSGINSLQVYYGVKRNPAIVDYNVDTYLTAAQMLIAGPNGNDWNNVSAVRIILSFVNPLAGQPGQPANITFERVIEVMARAGVHT